MLNTGQPEWEQPDPNMEPDPDRVVIPRIPWDDDNPPDLEDTENDDVDEEEEEG